MSRKKAKEPTDYEKARTLLMCLLEERGNITMNTFQSELGAADIGHFDRVDLLGSLERAGVIHVEWESDLMAITKA